MKTVKLQTNVNKKVYHGLRMWARKNKVIGKPAMILRAYLEQGLGR